MKNFDKIYEKFDQIILKVIQIWGKFSYFQG